MTCSCLYWPVYVYYSLFSLRVFPAECGPVHQVDGRFGFGISFLAFIFGPFCSDDNSEIVLTICLS